MKLHTKLYLFFAGIVLLPLLVVTVAASIQLGRSGAETYQGRLQSGLAAASAIVTAQAQVLAGDDQFGLQRADTGVLLSGDLARRTAVMNTMMADVGLAGAVLRDPAGTIVARTGEGNDAAASQPLIASNLRLSSPDGSIWRVTMLHSFDVESLSRVFSAQGLEWGLLKDGVVGAGSLGAGEVVRDAGGETFRTAERTVPASGIDATVGDSQTLATALLLPPEVTDGQVVLLAAVPASTVGAASREALLVGLGLMVAVALLAGLLGLFLARNITQPLRELTGVAAAGIEGDLDREVEIKSHDEIGSLANSFSLMRKNIRAYIGDLEESRTQLLLALSYAGEILGSTSDRERMMKTTAEAARLATGAGGIWVELFARNRPPVQHPVSAGVPAYFFDDHMKGQAAMLAEQVAARNIAAGRVLEFGTDTEAVAFPLMHKEEALGAMVAIFNLGHAAEENRKILGSLAAQASTAVANVNFGELQELLATTDPMTNLFNFRYLCSCLDKEISKSRRYGHPMSIAIIDLDDFKAINDTYGHQVGDEVLKAVGEVLASLVRESDMVARYGGEEFSVVFPETSKVSAMKVAEKLRQGIAGIALPDYPEVRITASIGVASLPEDGGEKTELLVRADNALYRAKEAGKNRSIAS